MTPSAKPSPGLVDHDTRLRHSLLGAYLVINLILVSFPTLFLLIRSGPLDLRATVPSLVLLVGVLVQWGLWRSGKDTIVAWVLVCSLTLATSLGSIVNGIRAPSTIGPMLLVLASGYLLGKRAAWIFGLVSIGVLLCVYLATNFGWLAVIEPPSEVWARVIAIQLVSSTTTLFIPLRGLLSGVRLIEQEARALAESLLALETQRSNLAQEVERRTRELETANTDLASFTYTLSHDLRAPLRSIEAYTRQLDSTEGLSANQTALVHRIQSLSIRLDREIDAAVQNARDES